MSDFDPPNIQPPRVQPPSMQPPYQPPSREPLTPRTSGKAVAAMLLGFMGMVMWLFTGIPAIILALSAKTDIREKDEVRGNGLANFALVLGGLSFFVPPILVLLVVIGMAGSNLDNEFYEADDDRIVHVHLVGALTEAPIEDPFAVFGDQPASFGGVLNVLESIEEDASVVALVITLDGFRPSMAHMEELHHAIADVVDSGKDVYVHSEEAMMSMPTYIMLSSASHINAVPTGFINLSGIYAEGIYLKDGLAKIGLEADIVHIGDYKSAGESLMRQGPSEAAEEAMNWLLDGLYESSLEMLSDGRGFSADEVRDLLNVGPYTSELAEEAELIDSRMYQDDFLDFLKDEYGRDIYIDNHFSPSGGDHASPSPFEELFSSDMGFYGDSVGIVYIEGNIMPGYGGNSASSGNARRALELAAEDDSVKAVVLRVNSPGGSVTASEVIWRAAKLLKEKKPLVVSMGNVAASGGYYISCGADAIFADATTITGSIGVVGGKIVTMGMWNELGISWHSYQRGENADWMSSAAPFNEFQRNQIIEQMGAAYVTFKDHVVEGRGDKLSKDIEEMAAGRVFTGAQAKELGLVDEIGGLNDAIEYAAELADMGYDYDIQTIPRIKTFGELLEEEFFGGGGDHPTDLSIEVESHPFSLDKLQGSLGGSQETTRLVALLGTFEPERSKEMIRMFQSAQLLNQEGVLVLMPYQPLVR